MSTGVSPEQIWISDLNKDEKIQSQFDRTTPVRFYDTTLRDGEQTVGVVFTPDEKVEIARKLSELKVGRIEAGFPRVSEADSQAVKRIAEAGLESEIWGFSRAVIEDLESIRTRATPSSRWRPTPPPRRGCGWGTSC